MSVLWRKAGADLWRSKGRSLLVVLSIAVGVFAVGLIFGMASQMTTGMDQTWRADRPPHVTMFLSVPIARNDVLALGRLPGIEGIEPMGAANARFLSSRDGNWHQAVVWMRDDFRRETYGLYSLGEGAWPQGDTLGMERLQADFYKVRIGDHVTLDVGGRELAFPVTGTIRHPYAPPPAIGTDLAFFFADAQSMAAHFGVPSGSFNALLIRVTPYSAERAREVASAVKERLAGQNVEIVETQYLDPDRHWGRDQMDPVLLTMEVMALASLILSTALVLNTVMALIAQQARQIAVLKAVGAGRSTIVKLYLATVLAYGLLALCVALPLGAVGAFYASRYFLTIFDIPHEGFQIAPQAVALQFLGALVVPALAALIPILSSGRTTVREIIASHGIGAGFGRNWLDRAAQRVGKALLPVRYAAALANTFRNKRRFLLTGLTLTIAGVLFLTLGAALASMSSTLDAEFGRREFDLTFRFENMQRADRVVAASRSIAGVERAELAFGHPVSILRQGTEEAGAHTRLTGVPLEDPMYRPIIVEGRWLEPGDQRVIVVGRDLARENKLSVGETVTLDLGELGRSDWRIVGLHRDLTSQLGATSIYAPRDTVWQATGQTGWGTFLVVRTQLHDSAGVRAVSDELQGLFRRQNMPVAEITTGAEERASMEKQFRQIVEMLDMLVLLTALVGGIGLLGALSLSVLERTKEIGVLRAIGARSRAIRGMFVLEAFVQAMVSWLVAFPLSLVCAPLLSNALGSMMFGAGLEYRYDDTSALVWLVLISIISLLSSILPARRAGMVSVSQSLAYE